MDKQKIQKLEEEIKNLHFNPQIAKHSFSDAETKEFFNWFWDIHVKPVIEFGKQMAEKYKADEEIVWLGAILHDIARLSDEEPHDEIGAERAEKLLREKGFSEETAKEVAAVIITHRCRKYTPENLEQKILASADAMAHFIPPFYFWVGRYTNRNFPEILEGNIKKIERDYNEKIFFEDEREIVKDQYEMLKKWFEYKVRK